MDKEKEDFYTFDLPNHPTKKQKVLITKSDQYDIDGKKHVLAHDFELAKTCTRACYIMVTEKAIEGDDDPHPSDKTLVEYFAEHIDSQDLFESKAKHSNFGRNKLLLWRFLHSKFPYDSFRDEHDWATNFSVNGVKWAKLGLSPEDEPTLFEAAVLDPTQQPTHPHVRLILFLFFFFLPIFLKEIVCQVEYINKLFTDHIVPDLKAVVRQHADDEVPHVWSKRVDGRKLLTAGHVAYALGLHELTIVPPDKTAETLEDIRERLCGPPAAASAVNKRRSKKAQGGGGAKEAGRRQNKTAK